jgi:hypothetical protein
MVLPSQIPAGSGLFQLLLWAHGFWTQPGWSSALTPFWYSAQNHACSWVVQRFIWGSRAVQRWFIGGWKPCLFMGGSKVHMGFTCSWKEVRRGLKTMLVHGGSKVHMGFICTSKVVQRQHCSPLCTKWVQESLLYKAWRLMLPCPAWHYHKRGCESVLRPPHFRRGWACTIIRNQNGARWDHGPS